MNIAIIGATGKFGRLFLAKLLTNPKYQITAISKSANSIYENSHRVTVKSIDATIQKDLEKALKEIDLVYCAVSGPDQAAIARNLTEIGVKRLIYMTVVGVYNELDSDNGGEYNLDNEKEQIPNRNAVDIIEKSNLNYTILRCGYLISGDENEYVITRKSESPKGYVSTFESVEKIALEIIENNEKYLNESISITKDMS